MSEKSRIGDHAKVRRGASPRPIGDPKYFGGTVGWVRISDATSAKKYLRKTEQYVSPLGESLSVRVDRGDLIMSICATIGRPVIVDMPACIHDGFVQFYEVNNDDKEYMYYLLQFHEKDLERKGQPGTQVNLNTTIVEDFEAFFPTSLAEQRKIARILSSVDAVIEKTEAAIAKYKAIKAGMMRDLFTRGIDLITGKLRPSYEDAPELYKESELGWVPKEWEVVSWEASCENVFVGIATSTTKYFTEIGVPLIRNQNILENKLDTTDLLHITKEFAQMNSSKTIKTGDVLSIRTGYPGQSAVALPAHDGFQSFTTLISRPKTENDSKFLCYLLNSHIGRRQILNLQGGGAQQNLNVGWLVKLKVPRPDVKEQKRISAQIDSVEDLIATEVVALNKYQQLKSALMSSLLTGKVRVKYDENENVEVM